jgi:hypothetical protein
VALPKPKNPIGKDGEACFAVLWGASRWFHFNSQIVFWTRAYHSRVFTLTATAVSNRFLSRFFPQLVIGPHQGCYRVSPTNRPHRRYSCRPMSTLHHVDFGYPNRKGLWAPLRTTHTLYKIFVKKDDQQQTKRFSTIYTHHFGMLSSVSLVYWKNKWPYWSIFNLTVWLHRKIILASKFY